MGWDQWRMHVIPKLKCILRVRLSHLVLSSHLQQQKEEEDGWQGLATAHQGSGPRVSGLHGPAGLWAETGRNHHAQEAGHSRSAEEACQGMFTLPVIRIWVRLSTVPRQRGAWTLLKQTVPCHDEHLNATRTIPHRQWYATCRTLGLVGCKAYRKSTTVVRFGSLSTRALESLKCAQFSS